MHGIDENAQARRRATLIGSFAVLMWASLAALTVGLGAIPPFQLLAMAYGVAFVTGIVWLLATGGIRAFRKFVQPPSYWLLAVYGLFVFQALYFVALRLAPAAEANLINYLWPLLIVLLSAFAPGGRQLRRAQVAGAAMGLAGTALLITGGGELSLSADNMWGYLAAFGCALVWSSYSVLNRRFADVPTEAIVGVYGAVTLLGVVAHLLFEPTAVRPNGSEWFALAAMGVGPFALALLAWDHGTKHGELAALGTLAYAAPVMSTLLLVTLGRAEPTLELGAACALVVGGAWIATRTSGATRKLAMENE